MGGPQHTLSDEWYIPVIKLLSATNPFCTLMFDRKWMKKSFRKQSKYLFRCYGHCAFANCQVSFRFCVLDAKFEPKNHQSLDVEIYYNGNPFHLKGEKHSRPIKKSERSLLKHSLKFNSPSSIYMKKFSKLSEIELDSGNRDKVGSSPSVLQKISSEGKKEEYRDVDLITSLHILKCEFDGTHSAGHGACAEYIQRICAFPFHVMCYTPIGIRLYHYLAKDSTLFCDATGTIVSMKGQNCIKDKALYYALVLRHPSGKHPLVAFAEFLSNEHSVLAVCFFLENFRNHKRNIYGRKNLIIPKHVVIDRSLVLLLSFLKVYNSESLSDYVHRCFRIVTGCAETGDHNLMFIHACVSHVMKSARNDFKKLL